MKLFLSKYDIEIELFENGSSCICIESPVIYRDIVSNLWGQCNGSEGIDILSDDGKELPLSKNAFFISTPLGISFNDKKVVNKLFQEIENIALEELYEETGNINSQIVSYLDQISQRLPYDIDFNYELDITAIAKAYKVRFNDDDEDFLSRLISYIKLVHEVCRIECFIFCNLKTFLSDFELESFYRELSYCHVHVLDIEGLFSYKVDNEKCYILDKDMCLINLD